MSIYKVRRLNRKSKIGTVIYNHILNNKRGYFIVSILFFIGVIVGVSFINNINQEKIEEINIYLNNMIKNIKSYENIEYIILLKESIISNFTTICILWLGASTIIGIFIVYGTIILKGFSIGCTVSSIIACFGIGKGVLIALSIMLLHNVIYIPTIMGSVVSGVKLYQSIIRNKERNNIKLELLRHTLFCILMLGLVILSSVIETYCSTNLFIMLLKKI